MSTKTLRKRIALVAATALGAGLLSVVAVPSANATASTMVVNTNATSGVASAGESIGLLGSSGTLLAQSAVILATGGLSTTYTGPAGATVLSASVTGGRFTAVTAITGTATISGTSSTSALTSSTANASFALLAVPNAGATSMVVSYFDAGVVKARVTVTIASTSAYDTYSAAYSYVYWGTGDPSTDDADTNAASANSTKDAEGTLAGSIALLDVYGNLLSADSGIVTATVTTGALVNLGHASTVGTTTLDYLSVTGAGIPFNIQQADVDVPWNGTVTIAIDGVVVATKSGIIKGEVASVTATSPKIGKKGETSNLLAATIAYADSAGNTLYPVSGTSAVSTTLGTIVNGLTAVYPTASPALAGSITMSCSSGTMGSVTGLQVEHLNTSGTIVKSNKWDSGCADVPYTVEASWDRVSYVPGSIATLTLKFKDSKGNLANAYDAIAGAAFSGTGSYVALTDTMTVAGGPSVAAITPIAAGDKPSGVTGIKTYQFVVGSIEGDFVAVIVPNRVKSNNATAVNISLPYSVKSATTGVTNADVLKAIVSLIASINKQIAALQKALLKKK